MVYSQKSLNAGRRMKKQLLTIAFFLKILYLCSKFSASIVLPNATFRRPLKDFFPFAARLFPVRCNVFSRSPQAGLLGPFAPFAPCFHAV